MPLYVVYTTIIASIFLDSSYIAIVIVNVATKLSYCYTKVAGYS